MQPIRRAVQLAMRDYDSQLPFVLLQTQQAAPELALRYTLKIRYIIRGDGGVFIHEYRLRHKW
jgi:hypothetical protein